MYNVYYGSTKLDITVADSDPNTVLATLEEELSAELPNEFPYGIFDCEFIQDTAQGKEYLVTSEGEDDEETNTITLKKAD